MDLLNGTQRVYSTIVTSPFSSFSPWFSQLKWLRICQENSVCPSNENLVVSLIGKIGDNIQYQITSDDIRAGTINVYDHVIEIWSSNTDHTDDVLVCQAIGTPSGLNLPLPFYLYVIECDSDVLENFSTTTFDDSTIFPILPLMGTIILTQTPLGQFIDQCGEVFDYRLAFIITTASLGGIVLFLFMMIVCLGCSLRRRGRPKDTSGIQLVRSGSRYTLSL